MTSFVTLLHDTFLSIIVNRYCFKSTCNGILFLIWGGPWKYRHGHLGNIKQNRAGTVRGKMALVKLYSREKKSFARRPLVLTAGALISLSVLVAGCSYIQDKYFPTTVYETESTTPATGIQVSVDPSAVVAPESIGEAVITTTTESTIPSFEAGYFRQPTDVPTELTVDSFSNFTAENTIEDLEKELGPYIRHEGAYYIWPLADGTEVWVSDFYPDAETSEDVQKKREEGVKRTLLDVVLVDGFDQTLITSFMEGGIFENTDFFDYEARHIIDREFGPELERGWYILQKGDDNYIVISAGKRETRDCRVWLYSIKLTRYDIGGELLTLTMDTEFYDEERPEIGPYPYPCCGLWINRLPQDILVQEPSGKRLPFMGTLVLDEE